MEQSQVHVPDNEHYRELKAFIEKNRNTPGPLIQVLHKAQEIFGYLPPEVQHYVAQELGVTYSQVYGVVTFYNFFRTEPIGDHIINVCLGTACYVKGADKVLAKIREELGIDFGQTTRDGLFSLEASRCLGTCGLAPVVMINSDVHANISADKVPGLLERYIQQTETAWNLKLPPRGEI